MTPANGSKGEPSRHGALASRSPLEPHHDGAPLTVGTAGHIDHGKTALITLLTGTNTDRLREERERGISIELGYAQLQLPSGRRLSVVDVPGHERFVRTMVAGATGIDLFLLVVAADDGVMPQTVEHLAILELLGVSAGVVALSKADLVDEELLALSYADVQGFLASTAYAGTQIVTVSARDGRGIPQLLGALEEVAAGVTARRTEGGVRLAVDRVFPIKGIGTVATGTLWRGQIRAGDVLRVEPGGASVTVRSVEVHDDPASAGLAGQRVGVNLRGAERAGLRRGAWLVAPHRGAAVTAWFDAWLRLVPGARPLGPGDQVRVHHGTAQHLARVQLLDRRELAGGEQAPLVLRLEDEAYVEPRDRFIVRSISPVATIGGGCVLGTPHVHERQVHAAYLTALHEGDAATAVLKLAYARGEAGVAAAEFAATVLGEAAAEEAMAAAARRHELDELQLPHGGRWFPTGTLPRLSDSLRDALVRRAGERPERPSMTLAELAALNEKLERAIVETLLASLVSSGVVVETEGGFAVAGAGALSEAQERAAAQLEERIAAVAFSPPTLPLLCEELGMARRHVLTLLSSLVRRGDLVRVSEELWFSRAAVDEARELLVNVLTRLSRISLAEYRDLLGTGRRNAQALLEHFDDEGLTRRLGDVRVLRGRR